MLNFYLQANRNAENVQVEKKKKRNRCVFKDWVEKYKHETCYINILQFPSVIKTNKPFAR